MSANENPILHLWSLAVEEQYYLFFPIILFFAFKRAKQTAIFMKVVLALLVIFLLTNFLPQSAYEKVGIYNLYYTSNLRFPELLVGSFLVLLPASTHSVRNQILSVLSIIGLVFCLFFYQKKQRSSNTNGLEPFFVPKLLRILVVFVVEKSISYKIVSEHFF